MDFTKLDFSEACLLIKGNYKNVIKSLEQHNFLITHLGKEKIITCFKNNFETMQIISSILGQENDEFYFISFPKFEVSKHLSTKELYVFKSTQKIKNKSL